VVAFLLGRLPVGAKKPSGDDKYCIPIVDYRTLYAIDDDIITVAVVNIGRRRDAYR
jgi:mRNA-degrading endonuclease RelE of RelBE toxin-antitoxin system